MTEQEIIDVVTAFKDGKKIQSRARKDTRQSEPYKWMPNHNPLWDFSLNEYRVAPEPRVIWINEYPQSLGMPRTTKEDALKNVEPRCIRKAVKFVEVEDES